MASEAAEDADEQPITALPLFGTLVLYAYADGRIVAADSASREVLMKEAELPCHQDIFNPAHRIDAVPLLDMDAAAGRSVATLQAFEETHSKGFLPAHIRGVASSWPAVAKWSFDYFASEFGSLEVQPTMPGGKKKAMLLAEYLAEVKSEGPDGEPRCRDREKPYLRGWYYERDLPQLAADLWGAEDFHEVAFRDWFKKLPKRHHPDFHWIYLGGAGSSTPTHVDPSLTSAWLTQIHGRKRFVLYPPCDLSAMLREPGKGGALMSPEQAAAQGLKGLEVMLEPGDTLFVPAFWAHYVECVDDSVSVTWNYVGKHLFPTLRTSFLAHQMGANSRAKVAEEVAEKIAEKVATPARATVEAVPEGGGDENTARNNTPAVQTVEAHVACDLPLIPMIVVLGLAAAAFMFIKKK